jgi:hypothetical protein
MYFNEIKQKLHELINKTNFLLSKFLFFKQKLIIILKASFNKTK